MNTRPGIVLIIFTLAMAACSDKKEASSHKATEPEPSNNDSSRVTLSEAAFVTAAIRTEAAVGQSGSALAGGIEVPGEIGFDARRVAIISPRVGGRIERVMAVAGDRVAAGQTAALLYTPSYITAQSEYLQARRRAQLLAGTTDEAGAKALVAAAESRLRQLGASVYVIRRLDASGEIQEQLPIVAPFSGSILESAAIAGSAVEAGAKLFTIADLSFVDVVAAVPEQSVPLVRIGAKAYVDVAAYPQGQFQGVVERMQQQLDEDTRTVGAVIHVRNVNLTLKPGMFATVRLSLPATGLTKAELSLVTIPESALLTEGDKRFVFVEIAPRMYERREVEVSSLEAPGAAQRTTSRVIVRTGVHPGEMVVVAGAFTLKSELGKAALGEHGH